MSQYRFLSGFLGLVFLFVFAAQPLQAAPYAAMVMDARTGEVLHSRNADTRLHPASLTKMMTLYIAFEAVRLGEITMDTPVTISANAAGEAPSRLGLRAGQTIRLRYLVRAAAVRSANDAATAIAEAISGSEAAFARRMTRTAQAMGMTRTTFRNAHGLTAEGHLSTAHDMTILGRRMVYDYPDYYNIFSRRSTDAGIAVVNNTNRALLDAYRGADGIKTGYTRAAGFNLVASAQRGDVRILATVFGGQSTAARNQRVMELLDMGFARAPASAPLRLSGFPVYSGDTVAEAAPVSSGSNTPRRSGLVQISLIPQPRPAPRSAPAPELLAAIQSAVEIALAPTDTPIATNTADPIPDPQTAAPISTPQPSPRPVLLASALAANALPATPEIVTRATASGNRLYAVSLGSHPTRDAAERRLLQMALSEPMLQEGLRHVRSDSGGFDAQFAGLSEEDAARACARLLARDVTCTIIGP